MSGFAHLEVSDDRFTTAGLRHATIDSPALGGRGDVTFWWPESAGPASPLVVLLHGVYGSAWAWPMKAGAHLTAATMVEAGEIPPLVLAMPSDGLWEDGSAYIPLPDGPDAEAWVAEDVIRLAGLVTPWRDGSGPVSVAGQSMGGWGALRLGARRPERFVASYGLSSVTRLSDLEGWISTPIERFGSHALGSPLDEVLTRRPRAAGPFGFCCGTDDPFLDGNRRLHRALLDAAVTHDYAEHEGGHEWSFWEHHLADALRFLSAAGALG